MLIFTGRNEVFGFPQPQYVMFNGLKIPIKCMPMKTVCGLDVHKDSVFLCILHDNGEKIQHKFGILTDELECMRDLMLSEGVEECAMESTSIYWIPIWRVLEGHCKLYLANPYFIKQLPGKKSDVKDAEWIATCLSNNLIAGSYVPEERIQRLRQYDRRIFDLTASISRNLVKLDACVQRCNMRLSNYVSTVDSKSYRTVVKMISEGQTDPQVLMGAIHGRTVNKYGKETILRSLTGVINETDIDIISQLVEEIELQQRQRDTAQQKMTDLTKEWFPEQFENLQTIPGVKERSATSIIAEVGTDMSNFQSPKKLVAWVGLRPRNEESAGKIKSRRIVHGNKFLRKTMIECSWSAAKTKDSYYNAFYHHQTAVRRKNKMKIQVAVARKLLTVVWYVLSANCQYKPYDHSAAGEES